MQEKFFLDGEFERGEGVAAALRLVTAAAAEAETARELRRRARDMKRAAAERR